MSLSLTLAVDDLERTDAFYGGLLGLDPERLVPAPGHPPLLLLVAGGATLLFRECAVIEALHPALFQNLQRHPKGVGVTIELTIPDLAPIRRRIDRQGRHVLYELEDEEFGRRELWLHDPDGYLVVLVEEPPAAEE